MPLEILHVSFVLDLDLVFDFDFDLELEDPDLDLGFDFDLDLENHVDNFGHMPPTCQRGYLRHAPPTS